MSTSKNSLPDLQFIRLFIKKRLKMKKWNYQKLADKLDVSEATVKRWLSQSDISVSRLSQIGKALDFSLLEINQAEFTGSAQFTYYNLVQENFLSRNPIAFYIFIKLAFGFSIKQIMSLTGMSEHELRQQLVELEKLKLLELWPGDKIRIKLRGPYRIRSESPFAKKINQQLKEVILRHFDRKFDDRVESPVFPSCTMFRPTEIHLSQKSAHQLSLDLTNLFIKYAQLSASEAKGQLKLEPVSILLGVDNFDAWLESSVPRRRR